jgi:uncharacterized protein
VKPDDIFVASPLLQDLDQARRGDASAALRAGYRYFTGLAGVRDADKARTYFQQAAAVFPAGGAWLAFLDVARGTRGGKPAVYEPGLKMLEHIASIGDSVGQTLLGRALQFGLAGHSPNRDAARKLYSAASPHFALAKTHLATLLLKDGDHTSAVALLKQAADAGETNAMKRLARLSMTKRQFPERNIAEAKRWLRLASERGDPWASYRLAALYRRLVTSPSSPGARPDHARRAFELIHRSAQANYRVAQLAMGLAYARGKLVPTKPELAQFWFMKASKVRA